MIDTYRSVAGVNGITFSEAIEGDGAVVCAHAY